jgi:hypothetical protein
LDLPFADERRTDLRTAAEGSLQFSQNRPETEFPDGKRV